MRFGWKLWLLGIGLALGASRLAAQDAGPSFACSATGNANEQAICHDPALAEADRTMARLFAATRSSAFGTGPSNLLAGQRAWLKGLGDCLKFSSVYKSREECLSGPYEERNQELAVAALFVETPLALATLHKVNPVAAPLYEALQLYMSEPAGAWSKPALAPQRQRLLTLLGPKFADLRGEYGGDILDGDGIKEPENALVSDKAFAETFEVLVAYAKVDRVPLPMPCVALLRRPGLMYAVEPMFDSSLDASIPEPDCDTTLPPLPKLDALQANIFKDWPNCQGSVRFSAYRSFDNAVTLARLGDFSRDAVARVSALRRVRGVPPAAVDAAIVELAAYYQRYRSASPARAQSAAHDAIASILDRAHHCGED